MFGSESEAAAVREDTARVLRAIAVMLSTVELDDSGQARRDFRRVSDAVERMSARAWARVQRAPSRPAERSVSHPLGPREGAIARLLAQGKTYKEIAELLRMGLSSVGTRVKSVYLKLGVHSRLGLQQRLLASELFGNASVNRGAEERAQDGTAG
jgi:DNA-binding NarL/FixJ family response regulator